MPWTRDGAGTNPHRPGRRWVPGQAGENTRCLASIGLDRDNKCRLPFGNGSPSKTNGLSCKAVAVQMQAFTSRSAKLIVALLIVSCVVCRVTSTVAGGSGTSHGRGIAVSLLDYDHILVSKDTDFVRGLPDRGSVHSGARRVPRERNLELISLEGFNLLWLIASKLEANDKLMRIGQDVNNTSSTPSSAPASDEIYLDSNWPRPYLRYGKKNAPISRVIATNAFLEHPPVLSSEFSDYLDTELENTHPIEKERTENDDPDVRENNIVRINRVIAGSSIGFEMEFRVEQHSGSGYIITGRSLVGQSLFVPSTTPQFANETSDKQSWFGLYSQTRSASYSLRLEYRNFAWHRKKQLQIRFSDNFRKGEWQKLAVNIDFNANTINYWVNCSARPLVQLRGNISHPSSFYSVYRLVQHRRRTTLPVKVTFREAVVTDGHRRTVPRQCDRARMTVCTGGKIYMSCGPSCERTCRGIQSPEITDDYLRTCAIACVSGCHCRPGYVTHDGVCVRPNQCPCLIGVVAYEVGRNLTINNEICTCVEGHWRCQRPPELPLKPKNLTISAGRSGQLSCGVAGNPQPTIVWDAPTGSTYRTVTKDFGRVSILVFLNVTAKEAGLYRCRASLLSAEWEEVATATVRIVARPVITLPSTIPVTEGHPILAIDCSVSGLPTPRIWWRRNGEIVKRSERVDLYPVSPGVVRLKIHNVQGTDAGEWSCLAHNYAGFARGIVRILVRLPQPNSMAFYRIPVDQYVKRGHTAMFNCEILRNPSTSLNVTWLKNGGNIDFTTKRVSTKGHRLIIRQVRDDDAGVYTCVVRVRAGGRGLRAKAELMIKGRMLSWSDWSACSATCDGGIMFKRRTCTGIPPNDKTCHGKFTHIKKCSTQVCPGVCSAIGDPHYTTFDGRRFNFHGDCGYVLSHDASGNEFKVLLYNGVCGTQLSCLNSVTVILSMPGLAAVVDIQRDELVTVNSVRVSLPYTAPGSPLVIDKVGLYIILNAGPEFELKWALPHRLYLIIGPKYVGRTQGFCGNFNRNQYDDNIVRSGRSANSDLEFGLNWAINEGNIDRSCSAFDNQNAPHCGDRILLETAIDACSYLLDKRSFGPCHEKVSPLPYIEACKFDICRTSIKRTNVYFCTALSAYAEECLRNGLVLNWRKEDICPETCYAGKLYEECGPRCVRYCPGVVNETGRVCSSNDRCVSGCHCPRDTVLHRGRCVAVEQCPCIEEGIEYENNETKNRNCESCVCRDGNWKCSFNKGLCEFPSSIIRAPLSQVMPSGKSVSFCCEAAGVPQPTIEWYRDGRAIPLQSTDDISDGNRDAVPAVTPVHGYTKQHLKIANLTREDAGSYYCKATNALGSQISQPARLTVVEPWTTSCNPTPARRIVNLPEGCSYARENFINVGYCPSLPCFYEESPLASVYGHQRKNTCGGTKQCCRPSAVQPVPVSCTHADYAFSFHVTTITQCACAICESRYTIVEGALLTVTTGKLLNHVKIDYQGRVMGYTSNTGSFSLRFYSLPEDARYVTLTFTDIMYQRFPSTIKNLQIINGETTTHKVLINGTGLKVLFDASDGLRHTLRSSYNRGERLRLIIPPSSLMLQHAEEPYVGKVLALISIVEKNYKYDRRLLHTVPGDFIGIDRRGNKQILLPSYVISVSLFSKLGQPLELFSEKSATFSVSTISFGEKVQPWVLDELTGLWRERVTKVQMEPHYNKRGEKVIQLIAKISRLNTAWALSDSEDACFLRVQTLDRDNNTVAGVRVVMTTTDDIPRSTTRLRRAHSDTSQMDALVEGLTRATDTNGICMPIGCTKYGYISAYNLANELSLLTPDKPPVEMGRVTAQRSPEYGVSSAILLTVNTLEFNYLDDLGETPKPSAALYFKSEEECRTTAADRRSYIFRDKSPKEVSDFTQPPRAAASTSKTRVAPLPEVPERRPHFARRGKTYCHVKVSVTTPERMSFSQRRNLGTLMILETATFSGRDGETEPTILGWKREPFRTPVRQTSFSRYRRPTPSGRNIRIRRVSKEVCAEYICGDERSAEVVFVTVKPAKDGYNRASTPMECQFIRSANMTRGGVRTRAHPGTPGSRKLSKGGYIVLPKTAEPTSRLRFGHRYLPDMVFPAKTLVESKNKCLASRGTQHITAWVGCS